MFSVGEVLGHGLREILLIDDVVAVEHAASAPAAERHVDALPDPDSRVSPIIEVPAIAEPASRGKFRTAQILVGHQGEQVMRITTAFLALLLVPRLAGAQQPTYGLTHPIRPYVPPDGFVPDSATAVRIATAVWAPIYGDYQFMSRQPLTATLSDGVWTVTGTVSAASLPSAGGFPLNGGAVKDAPYEVVLKIDKGDGRILYLGHS